MYFPEFVFLCEWLTIIENKTMQLAGNINELHLVGNLSYP